VLRALSVSFVYAFCVMSDEESEPESHCQRYIATDSQSVSKSWCRAQSGTCDLRYFFSLKVTVLSNWSALSDERSGLSFSQSQSYFTTDGQSVSMSWCRAQIGTGGWVEVFIIFGYVTRKRM
jgi:hypothetical protein